MKTGRPIMNPAARYDVTGKGFIAVPYFGGAHNWQPMSFSPETGLVYIPAMEISYPFVVTHEDDNPMGQKLSISFAGSAKMLQDPKALRVNKGFLLAWDPVKQKEVWRVPHGSGRSGGTLATAGGLVFAGNSKNEEFAAYRADTGERCGAAPRRPACWPGPSTFEVDGEQYVAVVAGYRLTGNYWAPNYSRLLVYKLGGTAKLPDAAAGSGAGAESAARLRHGADDRARPGRCTARFCSTLPRQRRVQPRHVPGPALRRRDQQRRGVQGHRHRWRARAERHGVVREGAAAGGAGGDSRVPGGEGDRVAEESADCSRRAGRRAPQSLQLKSLFF